MVRAAIFFSAVLSTLLSTERIQAQEAAKKLQAGPGSIECQTELQFCTYSARNTSASIIITRLTYALFAKNPLTGSGDGHIETVAPNVIQFWHKTPAILELMKRAIPVLDRFDDFHAQPLVDVWVRVFYTTEQGLSDFYTQLKSINVGPHAGSTPSNGVTASEDGTTNLQLNIGTAQVTQAIRAVRTSGELRQVESIHQIVPNQDTLNVSSGVPHFVSFPGSTDQHEKSLKGLKLTGSVSISGAENAVDIAGYDLSFGAIDPEDSSFIFTTKANQNNLTLVPGHPLIHVGATRSYDQKNKKMGAFIYGNRSGSNKSRVIILVTAEVATLAELAEKIPLAGVLTSNNREFSVDEALKLPQHADLNKALGSLKPFSASVDESSLLLGFFLDSELASLDHIFQKVHVTVKGGGINQSEDRELQNLMLSGFRFNDVPLKEFKKGKRPSMDIKVTLTPFSRSKDKKTFKKEYDLYFNAHTAKLSLQ